MVVSESKGFFFLKKGCVPEFGLKRRAARPSCPIISADSAIEGGDAQPHVLARAVAATVGVLRLDAGEAGAAGLCDILDENKMIATSLGGDAGVGSSRPQHWKAFTTMDNITYLALARTRTDAHNLKSHYYRYSMVSGLFELVQSLGAPVPGKAGRRWVAP